MNPQQAGHWLRTTNPVAAPRARVVCVPYAGGGATVFHKWASQLPPDVEVRAAQLPRRQDRFAEPALTRVSAIVLALEEALDALPPAPTVLYGHSLGALVAFELARALQARGQTPRALIVAAKGAAQLPNPNPKLTGISKQGFLEAMHVRYGTPWNVLNSEDLMALALPSLQADMEAFETYEFVPGPLLEAPLYVLRGLKDTGVTTERVEAWGVLSKSAIVIHAVDAGHFFVDTHRDWVLERVAEVVARHA